MHTLLHTGGRVDILVGCSSFKKSVYDTNLEKSFAERPICSTAEVGSLMQLFAKLRKFHHMMQLFLNVGVQEVTASIVSLLVKRNRSPAVDPVFVCLCVCCEAAADVQWSYFT